MLANASSTTFQLSGGKHVTLTLLTAADNANFLVSGGASLTLSGLTSYTGGGLFITSSGLGLETDPAANLLGSAVAIADFDADGYDDVAIGISGMQVGEVSWAGGVAVLFGAVVGFDPARTRVLHQDLPHVADKCEENDGFGGSLATTGLEQTVAEPDTGAAARADRSPRIGR